MDTRLVGGQGGLWSLGQSSLVLSGDVLTRSGLGAGTEPRLLLRQPSESWGCPTQTPRCSLFFRLSTGTPSVACSVYVHWLELTRQTEVERDWTMETEPLAMEAEYLRHDSVDGLCVHRLELSARLVCTAPPAEALGMWPGPGSPRWGSHVVGSGLHPGVSCLTLLPSQLLPGRWGPGHSGGLCRVADGAAGHWPGLCNFPKQGASPPRAVWKGGARLTLKGSGPTASQTGSL